MKSREIVRVFLVSLVLLSCGDTDVVGPPTSVAEARVLWKEHALTTYSYSASMACFCPGPAVPVRVDVANGKVVNVSDLGTHASIPTTGWYTIDELFDLAERTHPEVLLFDRYLGYPRKMEKCCREDDSGFALDVFSLYLIPIPY